MRLIEVFEDQIQWALVYAADHPNLLDNELARLFWHEHMGRFHNHEEADIIIAEVIRRRHADITSGLPLFNMAASHDD